MFVTAVVEEVIAFKEIFATYVKSRKFM